MLKLMKTLSFICLVMVISVGAQTPSSNDSSAPVLDTDGKALERGIEYYILPSESNDNGGGLTLIDRNGSCPLYVGQVDLASSQGFPVIFTPFNAEETVIREFRDFRVAFSASTTCVQSTAWKVGETTTDTERRLIVTGSDDGYLGFFRINMNGGRYSLGWCPTDVCPICRFMCGDAGVLVENGKRLLALDGPALSVIFKRA